MPPSPPGSEVSFSGSHSHQLCREYTTRLVISAHLKLALLSLPGPKTLPWQRLFKDHLLLPSPEYQQKSLARSRRSRGACGWLDAAIVGVR